ncbi:MAG: 3-phosphoshikimate 1-carboxyvinyltransferase [Oscillospiraceae bacterium]|nr:3-phosphoshikimate 1-carboxyvinyltransferase [Oscillospiraceae bacterium]
MDITIRPGKLRGTVTAIPSKSQAHRLLICAAFADAPTELICPETNRDIEATADCLNALGARITRTDTGYRCEPIRELPGEAVLNCCESGSTLRFMLPIAGALGVDTVFQMAGRLPQRPLSPLWEEMERMGCRLTRPTADTIRCQGKLKAGEYTISGGVSSQFITGLLFAQSLIPGRSHLEVTGRIESKPYIDMTQKAMALFEAPRYHSPGTITVEGDWSNGAFFLAAKALGNEVDVENLDPDSPQGDRAAARILPTMKQFTTIDAADIPDLVPILVITAGAKSGAAFHNIQRLRIKESDRVASTIAMIEALGGKAEATEDTLTVWGTGYLGGTVDAQNDHRIAMSAAIAATVCAGPVTILGAECVKKSYPKFWEEYERLSQNTCHSEPVLTLAWESPKIDSQSEKSGDCHTSLRTGSQ